MRKSLQFTTVLLVLALLGASCAGSKDGASSARSRLGGDAQSSDSVSSDTSGSAEATGQPGGSRPDPGSRGSVSEESSVEAGSSRGVANAPAAQGVGVRTGVTNNEVLFGLHHPQSGAVGALVGRMWHGAEAYFRSVNDAGGIHGRKIRLIVADDQYSAQGAASATRQLVDTNKVFAAAGPAGVDQVVVGAEYANKKGVPYLHGGMSEAFVQGRPWTFPVTTTYPYAGGRLIDYMFQKRGFTKARKIGAMYLNSQNLADMVPAMEKRLASYGSKFTVKCTSEKDQNDYSACITKMSNADVDTVWLHIDPTLMAKFAAQARSLRFQPQYVFTYPLGGDLSATAAAGNLDGAFGMASVADPQWSGAAEFRATHAKYYSDEEPDEFMMLCYVIARTFVEGLRRAGPDLGRDSFARAMADLTLDTGVSSPLNFANRGRVTAGNSKMAVWQIEGTSTNQKSGFDF